MYTYARLATFSSFVVLAGFLLILGVSPVVEANGIIENHTFAMVENPLFIDPIDGATGNGRLDADVVGKSNLKFELAIDAEGLLPNTLYDITMSVREDVGAPVNPADADVFVGPARTDSAGVLHFEGQGVVPNVFNIGSGDATEWRMDQQVRLRGSGLGTGGCTDCVLVCAPTTRLKKVDGQLVQGP